MIDVKIEVFYFLNNCEGRHFVYNFFIFCRNFFHRKLSNWVLVIVIGQSDSNVLAGNLSILNKNSFWCQNFNEVKEIEQTKFNSSEINGYFNQA